MSQDLDIGRPVVTGLRLAEEVLADLRAAILAAAAAGDRTASAGLSELDGPQRRAILLGALEASPFLGLLMRQDPVRLAHVLARALDDVLAAGQATLAASLARAETMPVAMAALRRFKAEAGLAIALGDLDGAALDVVTQALTRTADAAVAGAVGWLLQRAAARGDWHCNADIADPTTGCGYFVIAMGKHGAFELNYSSDIDLVVLYEPALAATSVAGDPQTFFVKLTRDLVKLMSERTSDGYVFRVDLRLRPDPGATQVAMSVPAALHYYESFGQNWERAAMIKARAIAGDLDAASRFLGELKPFIWRRNLDYAAIADIHAMKRQIHAYRGHGEVAVRGHNIKLGRGGIREIEFFTQTQQLIAGGRQADLRVSGTRAALDRLAARGWIEATVADNLARAYVFLRRLEHRLQMIADEQTQTLPKADADLARLARFAGFADEGALGAALVARLLTVERHYARLFESVPELTRGDRNMVFAGEQDDPQTLETLRGLGYADPAQVLAVVRGWHHGRYAAVSTPRGRERLTEVQPRLIEALAETIDPNAALAAFDRFLERLPAGVQLFSLLKSNPRLISVFALLMGSAPRLAGILSRHRRVIDTLLDPQMIARLPSAGELDRLIGTELDAAGDAEGRLDAARLISNEKRFLIGVRLLTGIITPSEAGTAYSLLAERLIRAVHTRVEAEFQRLHGRIDGGQMAVLAMGKLGGREMTAASDLDLIMIYDTPADALSCGTSKPLPPSSYYTRLTQRLVSALTVPTAEGPLYEVDMRLRPSGQKGPLATSLASFIAYQGSEAWTWEHMALTRASVVAGPTELAGVIEAAIRDVLTRPRDRPKLIADVRDMRERITSAKGSDSIWDLKVVRGGLIDIEFIAQALQLLSAAEHPAVLDPSTSVALDRLAAAGRLSDADHARLAASWRLFSALTQALRVMLEGTTNPRAAPAGVRQVLLRIAEAPSFDALDSELEERQAEVRAIFERVLG